MVLTQSGQFLEAGDALLDQVDLPVLGIAGLLEDLLRLGHFRG